MNYIAERRLEEKDRRRGEILDAAETVAASDGIDALTMDQVARQARISRALLYVYFRDRNDLHLGVSERGLSLLADRFESEASAHANGLLQLQGMGRAYVEFARAYPVYFEALTRFHASAPSGDTTVGCIASCLEAGNRVHTILVAAIEAGIRDGSVSSEAGNSVAIALTLWGFMHGVIQISTTKDLVLAQYGLSPQTLVEQALSLATRGLAK
jgi:AcrR family transcriptional regulator